MQQATCAHSGVDTGASPGNAHDISTPSRRGILTAFAIAPVVAAAPAIAASVPAGAAIPSDVARWEAGLRDLAEAERVLALARVDDDAARAAKAAGKPDGPHLDWEGLDGILPVRGHYERIDIARVRADTLMHIERGYWRHDPKHPLRRLAALDQLEAYRDAIQENDERHAARSTAAADRYDAAITAAYESEKRLIHMPAPHFPALLWKIERLVNDEGDGCTVSWSIDYVEPMLADARRLLRASA